MSAFDTSLLKVIPRTQDVSSFRFSNPKNIAYKAGQYLILTIDSEDKKISHPFSISNSPTEEGYLEITTKLSNSDFKNMLQAMRLGDKANFQGPFGNFVLGDDNLIGMFAGGIGITPFRSMIKYCIDKNLGTNIILLYGCHAVKDIIFRDEFDLIQSQNTNFKAIYVLEEIDRDSKGYVGYITDKIIKEEIPDFEKRQLYVCGPPSMVRAMEDILPKIGAYKEKIRVEHFTGY